jgi:hypothetical protein
MMPRDPWVPKFDRVTAAGERAVDREAETPEVRPTSERAISNG